MAVLNPAPIDQRKVVVATLQHILFTTWEPHQGFLFLLPSRLPDKKGDLILPESFTKKNNSGICFKAKVNFGQEEEFLGMECLFPVHTEFEVTDTDTKYLFYVVPADKVIMTRIPPSEILAVSKGKPGDSGFSIQSIEHSKKD